MTTVKEKPVPWVAVVYSPQKHRRSRAIINELLGSGIEMPIPAYPLLVGLPVEGIITKQPGISKNGRSILLKPGTNLGIPSSDWLNVRSHPLVAPKLESGVIEVVEPSIFDELQDPGYRCFPSAIAIQLIANTMHEDWIEQWLIGSTNAEILKAALAQRKSLIHVKEARAVA